MESFHSYINTTRVALNALRGRQSSSFLLMATTTQLSLPHNYEKLLCDADNKIDTSSCDKILIQLHAGVYLNKGKKKYWVEKESLRNCFFLHAKDLSITWGDDSRYWVWPLVKEGNECFQVAELVRVCWLEVQGKFPIDILSPKTTYEVVFVLKMKKGGGGWEVPVNVKLTLPDGCEQKHKVNLKNQPTEKWIEIKAGEFKTSANSCGEIQYSLYEIEGGQWKTGLEVKGVSIRPKCPTSV